MLLFLIGGLYIKYGLFQSLYLRNLIGVRQFYINDGLLTLKIKHRIEKGDKHLFMVLIPKDLLEGDIIFGICEFHWDDYTPH